MDTKWKNIRYHQSMKAAAVLLCIIGTLAVALSFLNATYFEYGVQSQQYIKSESYKNTIYIAYKNVCQIMFVYKNEYNIKSGATITNEMVEEEKKNIYRHRNESADNINTEYLSWIENAENSGNAKEASRLKAERDDLILKNSNKFDAQLNDIKSTLIKDQLNSYQEILRSLKDAGILYYVQDKNNITDNIGQTDAKTFFKSLPSYIYLSGIDNKIFSQGDAGFNDMRPEGTTIYLGMSKKLFETKQQEFAINRSKGIIGIYELCIGLLAFLISVIYLIYAAGRRPYSDEIHLLPFDNIYTDIAFVLCMAVISLCIAGVLVLNHPYPNISQSSYIPSILLIVLGVSSGIFFVTTASKRIKRREFLKYTLAGALIHWFLRKLQDFFNTFSRALKCGPSALRVALMFIAYSILIFLSILFTVFFSREGGLIGFLFGALIFVCINLFAMRFELKKVTLLKNIIDGAMRIKGGDLAYHIPEEGGEEMSLLASTINNIAQGFKVSVENKVKAERMKSELITNVSHDLKTPLTSIITYIDLLKTEGVNSENAAKYITVLDEKSQRLKVLTEDLFEAAKASSGSMPVNLERLDIGSLLEQGLGELSDRIKDSGLDFKVNIPYEKLCINADGKLLWRVIENLLSNVFKYALPKSRVYIDVVKNTGNVSLTVKNISAYELNISADELMERFKRGDESRHSEGSGLGLSIAKSLVEIQGGSFSVEIDGDLFKASVTLPL